MLDTFEWLAIGVGALVSLACLAIVWSTIRLGVFARRAELDILRLVGGVVPGAPTAFGHLLAAVDLRRSGTTEIAVVGDRPDLVAAIHARYLPNAVLAWGEPFPSPLWEGREPGQAYVCRHYTCQLPVRSVEDLLGQLDAPAAG